MKFELKHDQEELNFIIHNAKTFHPDYHTINLNGMFNLNHVRLKAYAYPNGHKNGFIELSQSSNNFDYSEEAIEQHKIAFDFIQKLNAFMENKPDFANEFSIFVANFVNEQNSK